MAIEISGTSAGEVGKATAGDARTAKRPMAATLSYLILVCDEILEAFPPGKVPPTEMVTLRTAEGNCSE